jgi:superfamily II DNA or RNA helicase/HKD family nuclease
MNGIANLTTGGPDDHFLPRLLEEINNASEIELAVSFIKSSGLRLLFGALQDALETRGVALRVLTSDYLEVTDPQALRMLMLLQERGADIRIYEANQHSFHLKSYIFLESDQGQWIQGCAFVGSSNISQAALTNGLEWNYRVGFPDKGSNQATERFTEIRHKFTALFNAPKSLTLTYPWIERYEQRRNVVPLHIAPGSDEAELPPPIPQGVQTEALDALWQSREQGFRRGLVVMATGLGKTYLAAFDARQSNAKRMLFVAHREEILLQAEQTFLSIWPKARVGYYTGKSKDTDVDLLFASVQTLGKERHLERFPTNHFDYVVVDEFHHAAAATYRLLLNHVKPRFLLGLTATPERTDQSDILSLCDDNLVFTCNLFAGIEQQLLCPFTYHGIYDDQVNYQEIPWRNGKFDPQQLSNKLATLARARHAFKEWQSKGLTRTLAFCVSIAHAQFMATRFQGWGIAAEAVYAGSAIRRAEALTQLDSGALQVIFSVDLFNEGVDLPRIDTVMMLRPTESKVLFLQQLGRGLRRHAGKERLVVLDFIGNHKGFLNKPQALFNVGSNYRALAEFARKAERNDLSLPAGCFANYDLSIIEFLKQLDAKGIRQEYDALKDSLGRRPTLTELYRAGVNITQVRNQYGSWWEMLASVGDLEQPEQPCVDRHLDWLREVETTAMSKSFKMLLLEVLLEHNGFLVPLSLEAVSHYSLTLFQRRRSLTADLPQKVSDIDHLSEALWHQYWKGNPIDAWLGQNRKSETKKWFKHHEGHFQPLFDVSTAEIDTFTALVQELVDYRLVTYAERKGVDTAVAVSSAEAGTRTEVASLNRAL